MPHVNQKLLARKGNSNKKLGLGLTMNGLRKQFRKKSNPKIEKKAK